MKKDKIIYWIATGFIFLFEGVMPALTSQTELAKEGIAHLGYPPYFGLMLTIFKVSGALALILPQVSARIKEWAYAGFGFVFIAAFVGHVSVDGLNAMAFFPLIVFGIMIVSYVYFHKLNNQN
jgi:DoxX-like family